MYAINRQVHIEAADNIAVGASSITYAASRGSRLIEAAQHGPRRGVRVSDDAGQTWRSIDDVATETGPPLGGEPEISAPEFMLDPKADRLISFVSEHVIVDRSVPGWADQAGLARRRTICQISNDAGESWSGPRPLIQHGPEFDEIHWMAGVEYGQNCCNVSGGDGIVLDDGTIIVPITFFRHFEGRYVEAPDGCWWLDAGCLRGRWRPDGSDVDWGVSELISLPREKSSRGLGEPTIVPLDAERLLMIARAGKPAESDFPAVKFHSISHDAGRTWSDPKPLTYDDGSTMYSPSSFVTALRWPAADNGLYIITNILDRDVDRPDSCDPRHPLQIARLDETDITVRRDTIAIIEDRRPEQAENLRLSNWRLIQDRQTGHVRLYMTPSVGDVGKRPDDNISANSFCYEIAPTA